MSGWAERFRPKTPSQWVMGVGLAGGVGFTAVEIFVASNYEMLGIKKFLAKDIALLMFYLQVVSHGIFTAGFASMSTLRIARNISNLVKPIKTVLEIVNRKSRHN